MASLQMHCSLKLTSPLLLVSNATASPSSASFAAEQIRVSGYPSIVCGRGDMRTAKGKRTRQSYGNSRPRNKSKGRGLPVTPLPQSGIKKNVESNSEEEAAFELDETLLTT